MARFKGFTAKCFAKHFIQAGEDSCWLWTGPTIQNGYGIYNGRVAHKVGYEQFVGPVPDKLDLDHLCRNRLCINPKHLEPVTRQENLLRGFDARGCKYGHLYTPENTYIVKVKIGLTGFSRRCKICHKQRNRNAKRRRSELRELSRAGN